MRDKNRHGVMIVMHYQVFLFVLLISNDRENGENPRTNDNSAFDIYIKQYSENINKQVI